MGIEHLLSLISLGMGLVTFIGGGVLWYKGSVEKRYAAERDFQHLRRNQDQINNHIIGMEDRVEEQNHALMNQLLEIKGLLYAALGDRTAGGTIRRNVGD